MRVSYRFGFSFFFLTNVFLNWYVSWSFLASQMSPWVSCHWSHPQSRVVTMLTHMGLNFCSYHKRYPSATCKRCFVLWFYISYPISVFVPPPSSAPFLSIYTLQVNIKFYKTRIHFLYISNNLHTHEKRLSGQQKNPETILNIPMYANMQKLT